MRLLLTRPERDAALSREKLALLGHDVVTAPLLDIRPLAGVQWPEQDWQALFVTSGNGARALAGYAQTERLRHVPVLAVGEQSAMRMRELGFTDVSSADGDVHALARLARDRLNPARGPVLHVAGSVRAGDLAQLIGPSYDFHRVVLYEAVAASRLPAHMIERLASKELDGILFYSPRTARVFHDLLQKSDLDQTWLGSVTAYCLSQAVAQSLPADIFKAMKIADKPTEASLFEQLASG